MSAPAGWRRGSWRGLPFVSLAHDLTAGRRLVVHEMPQADEPVIEDLGRATRRFSLECHIRGAGYLARANAFDDALQASGPGTLVHPWKGAMQVVVESFDRRDSVEEGGIAAFTIQFVESGVPARPAAGIDSSAASKALAGTIATAAVADFPAAFSVTGAPAFVADAGVDLISGVASIAAVQAGLAGASGDPLRQYSLAVAALTGAVLLVREPAALAVNIAGLVDALRLMSVPGNRQIAAMLAFAGWGVSGWGDSLDQVIGTTPARARQRQNQAALQQLVNLLGAAGLAQAVAASPIDSRGQAMTLRDQIAGLLDMLALRQADAGDDDGAARFDRLREAVTRDIVARAPAAALSRTVRLAETEPALVIAWRLRAAPALLARDVDELIIRNAIRHPGFVTGGSIIQVTVNG